MSSVFGLVALVLVGADEKAAGAVCPESFVVRVFEMDSVDWRNGIYSRLNRVGRQGAATVWTTRRDTARLLMSRAQRIDLLPKIAAGPAATGAFVLLSDDPAAAADVTHAACGLPHHAAAHHSDGDIIREGIEGSVTGRATDRGVVTALSCDATWIVGVHSVNVTASPLDDDAIEPRDASFQVEVPEVMTGGVYGEWLVPQGQVLLVSLGVRSAVDLDTIKKEDACCAMRVTERLLIVDPQVAETGTVAHWSAPRTVAKTDAMLQPASAIRAPSGEPAFERSAEMGMRLGAWLSPIARSVVEAAEPAKHTLLVPGSPDCDTAPQVPDAERGRAEIPCESSGTFSASERPRRPSSP
jgi:hypothetical protein